MVETQRSYVCKEMSAKIKLSKPGIFPQRKLGSPQVDGSSCVFLPALHSCLKHQKNPLLSWTQVKDCFQEPY